MKIQVSRGGAVAAGVISAISLSGCSMGGVSAIGGQSETSSEMVTVGDQEAPVDDGSVLAGWELVDSPHVPGAYLRYQELFEETFGAH